MNVLVTSADCSRHTTAPRLQKRDVGLAEEANLQKSAAGFVAIQ
jgi:hypothetical protein